MVGLCVALTCSEPYIYIREIGNSAISARYIYILCRNCGIADFA